MTRTRIQILIGFFMLVLLAMPVFARSINDSIVAIVNTEVITLKDLKDYISGIYRQLKVEHHSPEEIQEIMASYEDKGIKKLIEDKLILAAANEKGLEIRQEIVSKRLKEVKSKYPAEDEFINELSRQGMTVTDFKNKLMNQMKARYILDIEVRDKIFVNPQDVTNYYNEHMNEFTRKTRYDLQSIYISYDHGRQEARDKAEEARAKLAAGEDFEALNKKYSEMPSVGNIEQGQMVPAIEKEVFSLKVGDVSNVIEVDGGVYVFKVIGILPGRVQSLVECKDQIYNKLYDLIFQQKFTEWIDKLRKKNYVEIRD